MAGLKAIKTKIRSVQKTRTVTKAMEAVSAAKMRKTQQRALTGRAYARAAASALARLSGTKALESHPLARQTTAPARALYVVITSDKGLAGGLNSGVLRAAAADIERLGLDESSVSVVAIGRKASDFFRKRGFAVIATHLNTDDISVVALEEITLTAANRFVAGEAEVVKVVYQNFISTFEQRPTLRTVFPLSVSELQKVVADIVPARGAYAKQGTLVETAQPATYAIEPSEEEVLGVVVPKLASIFLYHALMESQASEHSARMVAMKSASDKASELQDSLTLDFNKARQAAITREVSEITGGMEAMATA